MYSQEPKRILIVDDAVILAAAMSLRLQSSGYECAVATSAEQALGAIHPGFDLVITDIDMPGLDGLELIRRIRSLCSVPMLVMTGFMPAAHARRLASEGITSIEKPFDTRLLLRAVVAAMAPQSRPLTLAHAA